MQLWRRLTILIDQFGNELARATPHTRRVAVERAIASVESWTADLKRENAAVLGELRKELLTNKTAMRIRETWELNKRLFNVKELAEEVGVHVKRPTIEHVLLAYYHPVNRLKELADNLNRIVREDPDQSRNRLFQRWRSRLRGLESQERITEDLRRLMKRHGVQTVRAFAEHLGTKEPHTNRKLPSNARKERLLEALAVGIWKEKTNSRAQEGLL